MHFYLQITFEFSVQPFAISLYNFSHHQVVVDERFEGGAIVYLKQGMPFSCLLFLP